MPFLTQRLSRLGIRPIRWRPFATISDVNRDDAGQNLTEKIVQRYAVDLAPGKIVRSGDYVSIRPEHCMSHDNCMSINSLNANSSLACGHEVPMFLWKGLIVVPGSWVSEQRKSSITDKSS